VRVQVELRACAGGLFPQLPREREIRIHDPILQVRASPVVDLADLTLLDQPPGERNRRHPTIVVIEIVKHTGLAGGGVHLSAKAYGDFSENVKAFERSDGDLLMKIGWNAISTISTSGRCDCCANRFAAC
jgi:hypothetical protein